MITHFKPVAASLVLVLVLVAVCVGMGQRQRSVDRPRQCPVCGMFVAPYPAWTCHAGLYDGNHFVFDGCKDLFRFCQHVSRYAPSYREADVAGIKVTDYYTGTLIDGRAAFYVIGSDVLGPMGQEAIPFATRDSAEEFRVDHHGDRVLAFGEITADLISDLD
ncbi:MAG: nitrous oxide reductase accessory protein NosL [Verrucomicrobiales bacterium]|nr:nitrous oxide reductase accessory protein NosL [Verrucomicrobiales bacterium]